MAVLVYTVVLRAIRAWGATLLWFTWGAITGLTMAIYVLPMVNRSPLIMELMWRAYLREDGEPGQTV